MVIILDFLQKMDKNHNIHHARTESILNDDKHITNILNKSFKKLVKFGDVK